MTTLADAILQEDLYLVKQFLRHGEDVNRLDQYGYRPLIEAAIVNNLEISQLLLSQHADPNLQDATGGTALHWAAENNNFKLAKLLLKKGANPNAYNLAGQPVLVMPSLRRQAQMRKLLIQHGADQAFALDYINTKLLGHMFELMGFATLIDPNNQFVQVDFEGFFLEVTIGLIADSLSQFQNHFAARQLRQYAGLAQYIVETLLRGAELIRYQQYQINIDDHRDKIESLLRQDPLLIPVGYEGHAITFIKYGDIWVKCDRREDSRLYDNIVFYKMQNPKALNIDSLKHILYEKQDSYFINVELEEVLGLSPITELKVEAQISGNCSWANVEAAIPALFFLILMQFNNKDEASLGHYKTLAINYFHQWRKWNKERALQFCIQSFKAGDVLRKACKAEILAAILFQACDPANYSDRYRIDAILEVFKESGYEYILQNYLKIYYYETGTQEGKRFYDLLRLHNFISDRRR